MLSLEILTAKGSQYAAELERLLVPSEMGDLEILPGHTALYANVREDCLELHSSGGESTYLWAKGGVLEVFPSGKVSLYCEQVTDLASFDAESIQKLLDEARGALQAVEETHPEYTRRLARCALFEKMKSLRKRF